MYLSRLQKDIVLSISRGNVKTILDFLNKFTLIISSIKGQPISPAKADFFFNEVQYKIIDVEDTYEKLIDFKKVINLLTKAELIEIDKSSGLSFGYLVKPDSPTHIIAILNSFRESLIIPYNELQKFAKDFLTPQERNQKRQLWIPIIVAITTVLVSAILNYFIYTKEREVYIKNVNAFKDSLYI